MNDPQLVLDAQAEKPGALSRLFTRWLPVVLGWCKRLASGRINAEDAAHDVFEVVLDRLPSLRDASAFSSWLYGITRRVLAAHRRKAWVRRWLPGVEPEGVDNTPSPLRRTEQSEVATRVHAALAQLSAHHREVLVLCDMEERPDSEVADMLGVPKGTVKSRLRRARIQLRALVPDLDSTDDAITATGGA
ncbi:MAG: RNA polymerase sigma-70 factor (ECF subfamily) [Myxococcota bacterium]|jgi:RNA polymerase sigma-70 factor (ECF subfamily)